ncbi:MAG: hypothetical protein ACRENO_10165 [Thermodesulfobacteriota bacterium]
MLFFDENQKPIILEDINTPVLSDWMWCLDLNLKDFTLAPLVIFEEVVCPSIEVQILGFKFTLPANWHILIFDEETLQLDTIPISKLADGGFTAVIYGPSFPNIVPGKVTVMDYFVNFRNIGPSLNKFQMLCHPISPESWVCISPSDNYNKYLKESLIGDLI